MATKESATAKEIAPLKRCQVLCTATIGKHTEDILGISKTLHTQRLLLEIPAQEHSGSTELQRELFLRSLFPGVQPPIQVLRNHCSHGP
jgi:hypothetical protein